MRVRDVIGDYMACALVTKTCTNFTTNHMETQNNCDFGTCGQSSARFLWFCVEEKTTSYYFLLAVINTSFLS